MSLRSASHTPSAAAEGTTRSASQEAGSLGMVTKLMLSSPMLWALMARPASVVREPIPGEVVSVPSAARAKA